MSSLEDSSSHRWSNKLASRQITDRCIDNIDVQMVNSVRPAAWKFRTAILFPEVNHTLVSEYDVEKMRISMSWTSESSWWSSIQNKEVKGCNLTARFIIWLFRTAISSNACPGLMDPYSAVIIGILYSERGSKTYLKWHQGRFLTRHCTRKIYG